MSKQYLSTSNEQKLKLPGTKEKTQILYLFFDLLSCMKKVRYRLKGAMVELFIRQTTWKRNREGLGLCYIIATTDATS